MIIMLTDYIDRLWSTANDTRRNRRVFSRARNLLRNVRVTARKKSHKSILYGLRSSNEQTNEQRLIEKLFSRRMKRIIRFFQPFERYFNNIAIVVKPGLEN